MKKAMQKYIGWGATIIITGAVTIAIFFCIFKFNGLAAGISKLVNILMPIIIGIGIAYVLSAPYDWLRHKYIRLLAHTFHWRSRKAVRCAGIFAMLTTFLGAAAIIGGLLALIVPQLISSVAGLAATLPSNMMHLSRTVQDLVVQYYPSGEETVMNAYAQAVSYIEEFVQNSFTPSVDTLGYVSAGVMNTVTVFKNIFIGIIVAIYLLAGKENFIRQIIRCIYAVLGKKWGNVIVEYGRFANQAFTGFITGKLLDSFIIFLISVVILNVMNMPFAMLVSVIIGVTNVIPFFGPFIGAIPSFIIIFIVSPLQSLYFLVFVLLLQQFDGNILGPKILGNSTGLSSFWVLFSILLFGGLFGFVGMLLGVPLFAVIKHILSDIITRSLRQKNLPVQATDYAWLASIDEQGNPVRLPVRTEKNKQKSSEKSEKSDESASDDTGDKTQDE